MNQKVWITGGAGLIGSYVLRARPASWIAVAPTRTELDLSERRAVEALVQRERPDLIIHCAGLTRSPACEANPTLARTLNVDVTRHIAELASNCRFIFFSTDLVFDGRKGAYLEDDAVNPQSVYALTKAEAEQIVLQNSRHTIVRTSLNFGVSRTGDRAFNEELRRTWAAGRTTRLFVDEFRCPIAAEVTARAVWELIQREVGGLFHLAGAEKLSRFEIGRLIAMSSFELKPRIEASLLREHEGPPRSPDTSLNCAKIQALLSFSLPAFSSWLERKRDSE